MSKKTQVTKSQTSVSSQQELCEKLCDKVMKSYDEGEQSARYVMALRRLKPGAMYRCGKYPQLFVGFKKDGKDIYLVTQEWDNVAKVWEEEQTHGQDYAKNLEEELTKHPLQLFEEAQAALDTGNIERYQIGAEETQSEMSGTEVLHFGSKDHLTSLKTDLEQRKNYAVIVRQCMETLIEQKKNSLQRITEQLHGVIAVFQKKIQKVMRVITTLELYLGIAEEITQIQEGTPAPASEPICIRQGLMFMDEEVGDPHDDGQGIEWKDIGDFAQWLTRNHNYQKVCPEQRGIVAFQCRRNEKDRGNLNPYVKMILDKQDKYTFLLMRNGENLYQLITDKISFRPRLFPKRNELQEFFEVWTFMNELEQQEDKRNNLKVGESRHLWSDDKTRFQARFGEKVTREMFPFSGKTADVKELSEDHVFFYKMRFTLFQGILERTQIFQPTSEPIQLFAKQGLGAIEKGLVRLIYDDELTLPSGRPGFWEWFGQVNVGITYGSRIILATGYAFKKNDEHSLEVGRSRFDDRFVSDKSYRIPKNPEAGLYYVKKGVKWTSEPIWIDNPSYDPSKPTTSNESRFNPEEEKDNDWKHEEVAMTYTDQLRYFGKIVARDPFDHNRKDLSNDEKRGCNVKVDWNPQLLHKCEVIMKSMRHEWYDDESKKSGATTKQVKHFKYLYQDIALNFPCIRYNPKDTVGEYNLFGYDDPHERKVNISWQISKKDNFILDFDAVQLEDVDFYLNSQVDRRHYIYMMPMLTKVRELKLREEQEEENFKQLVRAQVHQQCNQWPSVELVNDEVQAWKLNLKWKRAVAHDDEKALRMIVQRISKKL